MPTDHGDRLQPRKRFGQHFLHDREVIARIVESVRVGSEETLVEIGPGRGALTTSLLARCRLLHLVEHSQGSDWRLSDAPSDYIEQLSQAVFGICFEPARARTHHKLSQNRPADKTAVIAWTQKLHTTYKTLAYWMSNPDEQ